MAASKTLSDLVAQLSSLVNSTSEGPEKHQQISRLAEDIVDASRPPCADWAKRLAPCFEAVALRLFIEWNVFEAIPLGATISYANLAKAVKADESLIQRLAWSLTRVGILSQVGEEELAHTKYSKLYLPGQPDRTLFCFNYDETLVPAAKMREYFDEYGRKEPGEETHNPMGFGFGMPEKTSYELYYLTPERRIRFQDSMNFVQFAFTPMTGMYDFGWIEGKLREIDNDRVVFVDVGSGKGHITKAILKENPFIPRERCVLQDRPDIIEAVTAMKDPGLSGVQFQTHNFHTPQPIKGALIYWIRRCLHNYGDDICINVLAQMAGSMASDSKLLIVDNVVPNPPAIKECVLDFIMLNLGGKERTAKGWEDLVVRAGLRLAKVHGMDKELQVIECVKA
ncbi:O-methyltransferase [Colletotrichum plurivorum]|uniref:O-methyltransferase n=1 Tax=Colletotrichum plurivorum TaxID=2175906 RepID=A0A8H6NE97_9PEZI|nr:O-methyltransferase [Colletotrichum plurivorum]